MAETKLYSEIADRLISRIRSGQYAIAARLPSERTLAAEFNVSRPTIREAMIALEVSGYVTANERSGVFVNDRGNWPNEKVNEWRKPVEVLTAGELLEAMALLFSEVAGLAARSLDPQVSSTALDHQLLTEGGLSAFGHLAKLCDNMAISASIEWLIASAIETGIDKMGVIDGSYKQILAAVASGDDKHAMQLTKELFSQQFAANIGASQEPISRPTRGDDARLKLAARHPLAFTG